MDDFATRLRKVFPRRPFVFELVGAGVIFLWILYATSFVVVPFTHLMGIGLAALALVGLWGLHWLAAAVARSRGGIGEPLRAKEWVAWVVLPALLLSGYAAAKVRLPLRLRWELSEPAFAAAVSRGGETGEGWPRRIGLYRVRTMEEYGGTAHFFTQSFGFIPFNDAGFAYLPEGPPADLPASIEYRPLRGNWYTFTFYD